MRIRIRTYSWLLLMLLAAPRLASAELVWALSQDNRMVVFAPETPGTILREVQITGLLPGETLRAIDFRPADSQLYGFTTQFRLYRIHMWTGVAKSIGLNIRDVEIDNDEGLGFDFNPVTDEIRIINGTTNFRVNPSTGQVIDADPTSPSTQADADLTPGGNYVAAAYSNNYPGAADTTLVAITSSADRLVRIGGVGGPFAQPRRRDRHRAAHHSNRPARRPRHHRVEPGLCLSHQRWVLRDQPHDWSG